MGRQGYFVEFEWVRYVKCGYRGIEADNGYWDVSRWMAKGRATLRIGASNGGWWYGGSDALFWQRGGHLVGSMTDWYI